MMRREVQFLFCLLFFFSIWHVAASPTLAGADRFIGSDRFAKISEKMKSSVVNITLTRPTEAKKNRVRLLLDRFFGTKRTDDVEDFFTYILFQEFPQRILLEKLAGSGIIIQPDGLILTNDHVVAAQGALEVVLEDGRKFPAQVVGRDYLTDLALVKIEANGLPVVRFGNSESLRVGEWVLAIGNSLGLNYTVSAGIVSAKGRNLLEEDSRPYFNMIQTDAPINLGNSGGPLMNMKGEVVGVNTSIIPGGQSIGFAVPINEVKKVLPELIETGEVKRGWLGVTFQVSNGIKKFSIIDRVFANGPAEKAGLRPGDTILSINGISFSTAKEISETLKKAKIGSQMTLMVERDGKTVSTELVIEPMPIPAFEGRRGHPLGFEGFILRLPVRTRWLLIAGVILFVILLVDVNRDMERKKWKLLQRGKERRASERRRHIVPIEEIRMTAERRSAERRESDRRHKKQWLP